MPPAFSAIFIKPINKANMPINFKQISTATQQVSNKYHPQLFAFCPKYIHTLQLLPQENFFCSFNTVSAFRFSTAIYLVSLSIAFLQYIPISFHLLAIPATFALSPRATNLNSSLLVPVTMRLKISSLLLLKKSDTLPQILQ